VKLIISSGGLCTDSISMHILVNPSPISDFTMNVNPQYLSVNHFIFTNKTTYPNLINVTYVWDFGDGDTSSLTNPTHVYKTAGIFAVKLISTSVNGCKDSITKNAQVIATLMTVDFTIKMYVWVIQLILIIFQPSPMTHSLIFNGFSVMVHQQTP